MNTVKRVILGAILASSSTLLSACATSNSVDVVGSRAWHDVRTSEIEASHQAGEITTEEYFELKNEADHIRMERSTARRSRTSVSFGLGVIAHD